MDINKRRDEIITELWETGRINGLYMGIYSKSKENPIKVYIKRWLVMKGIKTNLNEMIDDFYSELFVHISKIKAESVTDKNGKVMKGIVELAENPRHLTAMICWIAKCQLFLERTEKKKHPNVSYFEKTDFNSLNRINSNGIELDVFVEEEDKEEDYSNFKRDYNITVEEVIEQMTPEELELFNEVAFKKGRILKAEKTAWENKEIEVYNIVNRIKFNRN
ncbi:MULTISPECIES: hypothetical protein [Sphingobacterium]|uniref:hypothetical protein n=1 Tax=Sphingobacterium TaxID=28453 RepID=UPI0013DA544F|nr:MULTISPECIES: hypothetical protein [unclassified Sphingobacterium]